MSPNRTHSLTVLFFGGLLLIAACGSRPNENVQTTPTPQPATDVEARLSALEARVRAQSPLSGSPTDLEAGKPISDVATRDGGAPRQAVDCPSDGLTLIRAETGTKCDDYQAEISAFQERCVANCDRKSIELSVIRSAAARCFEFCQKKDCSVTSFIPPPNGLARYECFTSSELCPNRECPLSEHGSLLDGRRVWNCVCRDIIPT